MSDCLSEADERMESTFEQRRKGRKGLVEKVKKETTFRRSELVVVDARSVVVERGCQIQGASFHSNAKLRGSPPPIHFPSAVSAFHITIILFISAS